MQRCLGLAGGRVIHATRGLDGLDRQQDGSVGVPLDVGKGCTGQLTRVRHARLALGARGLADGHE